MASQIRTARSGSLAQPKPCRSRQTEEQAHEKDEKEPRTGIQGQGAIAAIKGDKTLAELAEHFEIHPSQVSEWKQQLQESAADLFGSSPISKSVQPDLKAPYAKIGQFTLENDS